MCEHESYMQLQKYALHEIHRPVTPVSSGVTVPVYQLRDPKGWVAARSSLRLPVSCAGAQQMIVPAPSGCHSVTVPR